MSAIAVGGRRDCRRADRRATAISGELSNFLSIDDGQMKRRSARLRAARQRDAPGVAELVSAAYGHYVARIGRPPMCEDYAEVIRTRAVTIAEHARSIVGVIVLAVTPARAF